MIRTMGIDASSTATGVAIYSPSETFNGIVYSGVITPDAKLDPLTRFYTIANSIEEILNRYDVKQAWIEDSWVGANKRVSQLLARGSGIILDRVMPKCGWLLIPPASWRKVIGFEGKLSSKEAKMAALHYWKGSIQDHNEAEAACIAKACYLNLMNEGATRAA